MQYNYSHYEALKNLNNLEFMFGSLALSEEELLRYESDEDQYFQILIAEETPTGSYPQNSTVPKNDLIKLVYGTKEDLKKRYPGVADDALPSKGVSVDNDFINRDNAEKPVKDSDQMRLMYSTVRFLLQSRKLSQAMVYTWMDDADIPSDKKAQVHLVRDIFRAYNIVPPTYHLQTDQETELEDATKLEIPSDKCKYLVKPTYQSYFSIRLMLLLSGQAYYKTTDQTTGQTLYKQIWEPIYSTYEIIWEYGIDVSWSTFYASREDISKSGFRPNPPYTMVTLGYPPKPDLIGGYNLTAEQIAKWATAPDYEGELPFYPEKDSPQWKNRQIEYAVPPYPYMPCSCS